MPTKKTSDSTSPRKKRKTSPSSAAARRLPRQWTDEMDAFVKEKVREQGTKFATICADLNKEFGLKPIDVSNRWHNKLKKEKKADGVNGSKNVEVADGVDTSKNDVAADGVNTLKEEESDVAGC
ncbi:hypothetical protein HK104_009365 [Borealophlyctis nickersoniae]|nr:hypothetical protein HK104_009365 [Borealophlyctis nickersoniae]